MIEPGPTVVLAQGMLNPGFAAAAALSLITFGVHTFVGGVFVARPLLAARDLTPASRWLNYYCWHMVTVLLLAMSGGYAWAATRPEALDLAVFLTLLAAIFSPLCVGVALRGGIAPWKFPAASLFALIAIAGVVGCLDGVRVVLAIGS